MHFNPSDHIAMNLLNGFLFFVDDSFLCGRESSPNVTRSKTHRNAPKCDQTSPRCMQHGNIMKVASCFLSLKRAADTMRRTVQFRHIMTVRNELGDEMVEAYAGPAEGVRMMVASEWVRPDEIPYKNARGSHSISCELLSFLLSSTIT